MNSVNSGNSSVQVSDQSLDHSCYDLLLGRMMTTLAMLPQAIQAALLVDSFIMEAKESSDDQQDIVLDGVRLGSSVVILFTAFAGKYVLLRKFNTEAFIDSGKFFKENIFEPVRDKNLLIKALYYLYQCLFTLAGSGVFVGLIPVSFKAAVDILSEEFDTSLGLNLWILWMVRLPFMLGALLCNLLCFPAVLHYGGKKLVEDFRFLTPGDSRLIDETYLPMGSQGDPSPAPSVPQTIAELLLTAFMALGMKNFWQIPSVINACFGATDCPHPFIEEDHWVLTLIGVMSLFCMTLMARLNAASFGESCGKNHSLGVWVFTFLLTVLGGLANGFQQYQANGGSFSGFEGWPMILIACLSIFPMEAAPTIENFGTKEDENEERRVCRWTCSRS